MIYVEKPTAEKLDSLDVSSWNIWEKETSEFPWFYDEKEICYILEGEVVVTPEDGQPVRFGKGDLVTFDQGLRCTWNILSPIRKHYKFGD